MWRETGGTLTYALLYGLSMLVHVCLAVWLCRRRSIRLRVGVALGLCYIWGMNAGARILYDVMHSRFEWHNYFDPAYYTKPGMWGGPLAYLAMATAASILLARDRQRMLDLIVLTLPLPMILAKVACFANGCCYGAECSLPWAVTFPPGGADYTAPPGVARHPTQLYEIIVLVGIQAIFAVLDRERWKGTLMLWFVALYGFGRPLTELFRAAEKRETLIGPLTSSQTVCLTAALAGGLALVIGRYRATVKLPGATPDL